MRRQLLEAEPKMVPLRLNTLRKQKVASGAKARHIF